jgi:hypothetical protein
MRPLTVSLKRFKTISQTKDRDQMEHNDKLLIYMHIPKTGGTTLKNIINKQFEPGETWFHMEKDMPPKLNQKSKENSLKCVGGHCWYGLHKQFSKEYTYFTMLRNPIDRVISEYYYILERPHHKDHQKVMAMDLMGFMEQFPLKSTNQHTRRISGNISSPHLQTAIENIHKDFAVVGLTEMFDESLFLMKQSFGWNDIDYEKVNITKKRPSINQIDEKVRSELERKNELDMALYKYAENMILEKIAQFDTKTNQEFQSFMKQKKQE